MKALFFLICLLFLTKCTTTNIINYHNSTELNTLKDLSEYPPIEIKMRNGILYLTDSLQIPNDSILTFIKEDGKIETVSWKDVLRISIIKNGKGAWHGLIFGAISGGIIGGLMGLSSGDDPPNEWLPMTVTEKALYGGIGLGTVGGLTGTLIGALIGSRSNYYFENKIKH